MAQAVSVGLVGVEGSRCNVIVLLHLLCDHELNELKEEDGAEADDPGEGGVGLGPEGGEAGRGEVLGGGDEHVNEGCGEDHTRPKHLPTSKWEVIFLMDG